MRVASATSGWTPTYPVLATASTVVAFEVTDTGIGISERSSASISEAFQQADASTNRRYGGTGRVWQSAASSRTFLGGEIHLRSRAGEGSTFTLYLPQSYVGPARVTAKERAGHAPRCGRTEVPCTGRRKRCRNRPTIECIRARRCGVVIVEDDPHYSRILVDLARVGLKALVASRGVDALALALGKFASSDLARCFSAGHAWLGSAEPAETGSVHAAHPGANRHARRGSAARTGRRRFCVRQ